MSKKSEFEKLLERPGVVVCNTRDEWLEARRHAVGASDAPVLFGQGFSGQSIYSLWVDKTRPAAPQDDDADAWRLRVGTMLEPGLRSIFQAVTGHDVYALPYAIFHAHDLPIAAATLDGLCYDPQFGWAPVELKNVSNFNASDWREGGVPLRVQIQVQQQLLCLGASHAFVLALIGGNKPEVRIVERDEVFLDALRRVLVEFWRHVETKTPPPVDDSVATKQAIQRAYPADDGETVFVDELDTWGDELASVKDQLRTLKARETQLENQIQAAIGDATYAEGPRGTRYSWKLQNRKEYTVAATSFRVLRRASK